MKVSVIIPCYNYEQYITEAIDSVFNQSYKDFECIVVNDGSTDNSLSLLRELKSEKYPELIIVDKSNGGLSSARNAGLLIAKGSFIAFLDADDFWMPNKLENQIKIFKEAEADIVYSNYNFFENEKQYNHCEKIIPEPTIIDFIRKNPILGSSSSIILKKEVCDNIGFFDSNLRSLEDLDYWFRCSLNNYVFKFCNSIDVCLRKHSIGNMSSNYMRMLSYHLIVFDNQINLIQQSNHSINKKNLIKAIEERLSLIRWYSSQLNKFEYSILTTLIGIRLVGFRYLFSRLLLVRLLKDLSNLAFKKRNILL